MADNILVEVITKGTENATNGYQQIADSAKKASDSINTVTQAEKDLQKATDIIAQSTDGLTAKQLKLRESINSVGGIIQKNTGTVRENSAMNKQLQTQLTTLIAEFDKETTSQKKNTDALKENTTKQVSLRGEIKQSREELARMMATGDLTTAQIYSMAKGAGNLKDAFGGASGAIQVLSSDTFALDATIQTVQSLTAGFQVFQGVQALVGDENKDLQQVLVKLNAIMAITAGLQQIQNNIQNNTAQSLAINVVWNRLLGNSYDAQTGAVIRSTLATKAFRLALAATGIGLIIILVASLIANWDKLSKSISFSKETTDKMTKIWKGFVDIVRGVVGSALTFLKNGLEIVGKSVLALLLPTPSNLRAVKDAWSKAGEETSKAYKDGVEKGRISDANNALIKANEDRAKVYKNESDLASSLGQERLALIKTLQEKEALLHASQIKIRKGDIKENIEQQVEYNNATRAISEYDLKVKEDAQKKREELDKKRLEAQKNNLQDEISQIKANIIQQESAGKATYDLQVKLIKKEAELALLSAKGAGSKAEIEATKNKKILDLSKSFEDEYQKIIEDGNKARRELGLNDFDLEISRINSEADLKVEALKKSKAKELLASQNAGGGGAENDAIISSFKAQIDGVNEARNKSLFEADLKYFNKYFQKLEDYQNKIIEQNKFTNNELVTIENQRYLTELNALNGSNLSQQDRLKEREEIEKKHKAELLAIEIKSQKDLFAVELDGALKRLQIVEQQYKDELDAQGFVSEETIKKKDDITKFIQDTTQKQNDFTVESGIESAKKQIETEEEKEQKVKQLREDRVNFASQLEDKLYSFTNFLIDNQQKNLDNQLKKGLISQKEYDKKTAELKRKQAIADKANAAFKIGIGIAEAIVAALGAGPLGIALAAISAALGAAQLAVVLATPIPQFKKGGLTDRIFYGSGFVKGKRHEQGGVNANLEGTEFVHKREAVSKYGVPFLESINNLSFKMPSFPTTLSQKKDIVYDFSNMEKLMNENNDYLYKLTKKNNNQTIIIKENGRVYS